MSSELRFDDRVAVVTGAGRGLGREYALLLARRGAHVLVNDPGFDLAGAEPDESVAAAVVEEIEREGGRAVADHTAIGPGAGAAVIEAARRAFGRVDIVVNNGGTSRTFRAKAVSDRRPEDIDLTITSHLRGTI